LNGCWQALKELLNVFGLLIFIVLASIIITAVVIPPVFVVLEGIRFSLLPLLILGIPSGQHASHSKFYARLFRFTDKGTSKAAGNRGKSSAHVHVLKDEGKQDFWSCDVCNAMSENMPDASTRWRCASGCDWDICAQCFNVELAQARADRGEGKEEEEREAEELSWLEEGGGPSKSPSRVKGGKQRQGSGAAAWERGRRSERLAMVNRFFSQRFLEKSGGAAAVCCENYEELPNGLRRQVENKHTHARRLLATPLHLLTPRETRRVTNNTLGQWTRW